jgi:hypothetical protein
MLKNFRKLLRHNPLVFGRTQFSWRNWFSDLHTIVNPSKSATIISKASQKVANDLLKKSGAFQREGVKGEPIITAKEVILLLAAFSIGPTLFYSIETLHQTWILLALIPAVFIYALAAE